MIVCITCYFFVYKFGLKSCKISRAKIILLTADTRRRSQTNCDDSIKVSPCHSRGMVKTNFKPSCTEGGQQTLLCVMYLIHGPLILFVMIPLLAQAVKTPINSLGHSEAGEINTQRFLSLIRLEVFVYYRPLIISVRISKAFIFRKLFTFSSEPSWR